MKNDSTATFLNVVLAALVLLGVVFALLDMTRAAKLRHMQANLQQRMQKTQFAGARAQALLNDTIAFNATAKNPDLARIIQAAQTPAPAAK